MSRDYRRSVQDIEEETDVPVEIPLIDLTEDDEGDEYLTSFADIEVTHTQPALHTRESKLRQQNTSQPSLGLAEMRFCRLEDNTIIKPGDVVELRLPSHRNDGTLQSGDLLHVKKILRITTTDSIELRGHKMLRTKYCPRIFDDKLNELVMHLEIRQYDNRPASNQGLIRFPLEEVIGKRDVVLTDKPYPMLSWRDQEHPQFINAMSLENQKKKLFHHGKLVCRRVLISIMSPNGKVYGSVTRDLRKNEITFTSTERLRNSKAGNTSNRNNSFLAVGPAAQAGIRTTHESSMTLLDFSRTRIAMPKKKTRYTIIDVCCGAGGASRGADNAGLHVLAGVDMDRLAISAWEKNFPGGIPLAMNMHDLPEVSRELLGHPDMMWFSFSCQPYSPAHTIVGKNDEENTRGIEAVKPIMKKFKPSIVVLENTFGLANMKKNTQHFHRLLKSMISAGYNVRWEILNAMDYGVPQIRKRVFIIASRKGIPLPPMPKPICGPSGSGLRPYVSIGDALKPLERLGERAYNDRYHQPNVMKTRYEMPYDPYTRATDCIKTGGASLCHSSGTRDFTPRELAFFQTLPYHHQLTGPRTTAVKQLGNMVPARMAEVILTTCARTLEAFHHGFITADEDIEDLDIILIEKGIDIPELHTTPTSLVDLTSSTKRTASPYRYLTRPQLSDARKVIFSSAFAERKVEKQPAPNKSTKRTSSSANLSSGLLDAFDRDLSLHPSPAKRRRPGRQVAMFTGDDDELTWL